ncbi:Arabinanase/levansucrase/invertase [Rhizoctonia solani]|nr:Arabinanase/levansucrase/invertase [Rhizoctonia solani]
MRLSQFIPLFSLLSVCAFAATFQNPVKSVLGSDPFMASIYGSAKVYANGYYYLTTTTWSNIQITRATSMSGLKTATPKTVWSDSSPDRCCNVWAPEIHWVSGGWHIYYTAGRSGTLTEQRTHVLKASSGDIWASTWSYAGRIVIPNRDVWAIDATVLNMGSANYLVYSGQDGYEQCLYIAKMNSATSVGNSVLISRPTNAWERVGAPVNEGPAPLQHGGRTWIVYSASYCDANGYSLGRLELTGSDPLSPTSWTKYNAGPIFSTANGEYGPGHNGFFTAPSGNIYNVYHASPTSTVKCDGSRRTFVQSVGWNSDGTPNLGQPRPIGENIPEPA